MDHRSILEQITEKVKGIAMIAAAAADYALKTDERPRKDEKTAQKAAGKPRRVLRSKH